MERAKVGIIGVGPIGAILSAHLSKLTQELYLVDVWKEQIDSIKAHGIKIEGFLDLHACLPNAFLSIEELYNKEIDYLFICVKANILPQIISELKGFNIEKTSFICFQNGIDIEKILLESLPANRIYRGVVNYAGMIIKPGLVRMTFFNAPNYIGSFDPELIDKAKEIALFLSLAGLTSKYTDDIQKEVWRKTILNSILMPISVLTHLSMDKIMGYDGTREIVKNLLRDFIKVAKAEGHIFEENFFDNAITYLSKASDHKPSMLMDFEMGKPLEIGFLNVKLQEYCKKHNISSESNCTLISLVNGLLIDRDMK